MGEARRVFGPELADLLDTSRVKFEDVIRWSSLGARCQRARADRGVTIRDVAIALKVPQYRLQAIEKGALRELKTTIARRYFQFLGIESWVRRWSRANRELARRAGMVPGATRERAS
ncbi:MAG TPA: helix-turn-helix domain-containing protein [Methylomirabilota bacterium]|nr:helix-turn-helix domain-containing protein [Methylomirabilota bacterium]